MDLDDLPMIPDHLFLLEAEEKEIRDRDAVIRAYHRELLLGEGGINHTWLKRHFRIGCGTRAFVYGSPSSHM